MRKFLNLILVIGAFLCSSKGSLEAWNETGHMVVAEIAKNQLKPAAKEEVERLISLFSADYPESSTFVTAATWADDLREYGLDAFSQWHYMVIPYDPKGILTKEDFSRIFAEQKNNNVKWALKQCVATLKNPDADDFEKALMLRLLLHFVGDIHQPMHCTSLFSENYPTGDVGGNLYKINVPEKNLHKYWDTAAGYFQVMSRPLDETGENYIKNLAQEAMQTYPYKLARAHLVTKISAWPKESHALATMVSYQIPENSEPTAEYAQEVQETAKARVALAGYRLAHLLNSIFDK